MVFDEIVQNPQHYTGNFHFDLTPAMVMAP